MKDASMRFRNADHMAYVTYPLINDPKLIVVITENLYHALLNAINALLEYEHYHKRIEFIPESLNEKIKTFRDQISKTYGFPREISVIFEDLHKIIEFKEKSPIEFIRKSNYIICDNAYSTKMINFQKIKGQVIIIKPFIQKVQNILN